MSQRAVRSVEELLTLPAGGRESSNGLDRLEACGQAIIGLVDKAAGGAKDDRDRALDVAHKLSIQLREVEDRATRLQSKVAHFQERAVHAEKWMLIIQQEIENKLLANSEPSDRTPTRRS